MAEGRKKLESSAAWRDVKQKFFATGHAQSVQRALTQAADRAVIEAYQSVLAPVLAGGAAMLAAGGYARSELFPFSDVDIIIVREGEAPPGYNEAVAEFVHLLWERGMRPGHRTCGIGECLAAPGQNVDLAFKLLDRRVLAGDAGFAAMLADKLAGSVAKHRQELTRRLVALARARHAKYQNTASHREPDVKETPGGLRDLRLIGTLAMLSPQQVKSSEAAGGAAEFLSMVRCFLHYRAREDRNLLDAPAQEAIVEQFARGANVSLWMREYFRNARAVFNDARRALEACEAGGGSLIETFRTWQSRLSNEEFTVLRERVYLRRPGDLAGDAGAVFRLVEFIARHGIQPALETERQLANARTAVASLCEQPRSLWPTLKAILSQPHAAGAFRVLRDTGLLSAVFSEWVRIEGVFGKDSDHLYTMDEHTLMAMERICDLSATAEPASRRFSELLSGAEDQALLLFALLFHHIGDGPDALRTAADLALAAGVRFEMPAPDRETVEFLIEQQAGLSDVVSGRDVYDPATIRALSGRIGTVERLRLLTALTYADIAATYSEAMLPLRVEQLRRTYLAAERELTRGLETDRIGELPASLAKAADFIRGFPVRYLRARTAAEIEADVRLYELSRPTGVEVELVRLAGAYKLSVVAGDKPALFASFAGAISSFGLDIVKAEAFSNSRGVILDTFVFADPKRTLELNPPETERLQDLIRRVASGKTEARRLFRNQVRREAKTRTFQPQVRFDSEACETATLVEIVAWDRPGLLYSLATVFASNACNIDIVLIDTKGRRAMDVFYVAKDGGRLSSGMQAVLKEQLLSACLGE